MRVCRAQNKRRTGLSLRVVPAVLGGTLVACPVHASVPEYVVPIRWCGVVGSPMFSHPDILRLESPDAAGFLDGLAESEHSDTLESDAALQSRSRHPQVVAAFTREKTSIAFDSSLPNAKLREGRMAQGLPLLPRGSWDAGSGFVFGEAMTQECQKAWQGGDALYVDVDGDGVVSTQDIRLSPGDLNMPSGPVGSECTPNFGATLLPLTASTFMKGVKYGYVDDNESKGYDPGDSIYRFTEGPDDQRCGEWRCVTTQDILLYPVGLPGPRLPGDIAPGSSVKNYNPKHVEERAGITPFEDGENVKYVDLIRTPEHEFSIGFGTLEATGVYAVSTPDYEMNSSTSAKCVTGDETPLGAFAQYPTLGHSLGYSHQIFDFGERMLDRSDVRNRRELRALEQSCAPQPIVVDDPVWMIESGIYRKFEPLLVAHELGHALGLPHGDGVDNDGNGLVDDEVERECNPDICSTPPGVRADSKSGEFTRTTCFVDPGDGPVSSGASNMMQYCWNFEQDGSFTKSRLDSDNGFDGTQAFSDAQYKAMQAYAEECGFRVKPPESAAAAKKPGAERTHRIERVDAWKDTFQADLGWLDIGRYSYRVTQVPGLDRPRLKFRVSFPQKRRRDVMPFDLWLGVEARPAESSNLGKDGGKSGLVRINGPGEVHKNIAQARVLIKAQMKQDGMIQTSFWQQEGDGLIPVEVDGVDSSFSVIETPSGFLPPGYFSSRESRELPVRGHALELTIPAGCFPVPLGNSFSLLAMSVGPDGRLADVAFGSEIRNVPPQPPGSASSSSPTCVVSSVDGVGLEKLPRSGRLKVEARGLLEDRRVALDVNGVRVSEIRSPGGDPSANPGDLVKTDSEGKVTLLVNGDALPLSANDGDGVPAVISVGAGASQAICGVEFYNSAESLDWNCDVDMPNNSDNPDLDRYSCHYENMCEPGEFAYVKPSGKYCPDGSLAKEAMLDWPMLGCHQGEPVCLVPVGPHGEPNCFNTVFNMPPGADWSALGLGFAYNFTLWTWDGRACTNRSLAKYGLDFQAPEVRAKCLPDPDGDGIPSLTDWCPDNYGFCYYDWETKTFQFLGRCRPD